jgi:hypothetical protein
MKLLAIALVLFACKSEKASTPDRWAEVERLATPLVPGGDGTLLDSALAKVTAEDVPEAALDDAIAWRKANGGLPWRTGRALDDQRPFRTMKLGIALVERRSDVATTLYLAQRMRSEGAAMIDIAIGFDLAKKVVDAKLPVIPELAPTEAEVRRAPATEGMFFVANVKDDGVTLPALRAHYQRLALDAPPDREGFAKHIEVANEIAKKNPITEIVAVTQMPTLAREWFGVIDAYQAAGR